MSNAVDNKIVSMEFDNKNFESNVQTSLSTLDKLKQSLNFTGASKGLENVGTAAGKLNFDKAEFAATRAGFHIQDVFEKATRFLENNIASRIVSIGTNLVKAFTIDPVKTGFEEYELKMNSVQTIMASTGESIDVVNKYLNELNTYSDKTIYSFSDMTNSIGKFTNAGVKLDDAVAAIQGISNEAAVSGANANEASRAMYNFAQALSAGYVKLIDWKSIENANMATVEFKQQLIDTAVACGTLTKNLDGTYKTLKGNVMSATQNFNDTLQDQWMTSEVLISTLKEYADETTEIGKKAFASAQDVKTFSMMMDTLKEAVQSGWAQSFEIIFGDLEEAKALWTGLANFFGNIIGVISDARNAFLEKALGNPFVDMFNKVMKATEAVKEATAAVTDLGNIVDKVIRGDFGNGQTRFDALTEAGYNWAEVQNAVNEKLGCSYRYSTDLAGATGTLTDAQNAQADSAKALDRILASYTNAQLKEMGLTEEEIALFRDLQKQSMLTGKTVSELVAEIGEMDGRTMLIESFANIGKVLVAVFGQLKEAWSEIFPSVSAINLFFLIKRFYEFTKTLSLTGDTAKRVKSAFKGVFSIIDILRRIVGGALKAAFTVLNKVIGDSSGGIFKMASNIGNALTVFHDWLAENELIEKAFSLLSSAIITVIDAVKSFLHWLGEIEEIKAFRLGVKNVIGMIGSMIHYLTLLDSITLDDLKLAATRVWETFKRNFPKAAAVIDTVVTAISSAVDAITSFSDSVGATDIFGSIGAGIGNVINVIKNVVSTLRNLDSVSFGDISAGLSEIWSALTGNFSIDATELITIGQNIIQGLINGVNTYAPSIVATLINLGTSLINAVKGVLGIHSPSTVFFDIGKNIILGLVNGLRYLGNLVVSYITSLATSLPEAFNGIVTSITAFFANINWGGIFAAGITAALLWLVKVLTSAVGTLASPLEGLGDLFEGVGKVLNKAAKPISKILKNTAKVVKSFSKVLNSISFSIKAKAIGAMAKDLAVSLLLLVGAVAILTFFDKDKLWDSVKIVLALAGIFAGLVVVVEGMAILATKLGDGSADFAKMAIGMLGVSASLLIIAKVVQTIGSFDAGTAEAGFNGLLKIVGALAAVIVAYGLCVKGESAKNIKQLGSMLIKMAVAMALMVGVVKLVSLLSPAEMIQGAKFAGAFALFVFALAVSNRVAGEHIAKLGSMLIKMAVAMALMVGVVKLVSLLDPAEMIQGAKFAAGFAVFTLALSVAMRIAGQNGNKLGSTLLKMAVAMAIMVGVVKLVSLLKPEEMIKGAKFAVGFLVFVLALAGISRLAKDANKLASTMLAFAGAVAILAVVAALIGWLPKEQLTRGLIAVGVLCACMALMTVATHWAKKCQKNLMVMTVAIAVLAVAVAALSFIKPEKLGPAVASMAILMMMFALMELAAGQAKGALGNLIVMTVAVAALGIIVGVLSTLNVDNVVKVALSMSALMLALSASLLIVSKADKVSTNAILALAGMIAALFVVGLILSVLAGMNIESSIGLVASLAVLMLTLAAAVYIIGSASATSVAGAAALLIISVGLIAIAAALRILADVPTDSLANGIIALGVALLVLIVAAAGMEAFAVGAGVLAVVLIALGVALLASAAAFYIFAVALPIAAAGITALGESIANFVITIANAHDSVSNFSDVMLTIGSSIFSVLVSVSGGLVIAAGAAIIFSVAAVVLGAGLLVAGIGMVAAAAGVFVLAAAIAFLCDVVAAGMTAIVGAAISLEEAAKAAGTNLVAGFAAGISESVGTVISACAGFVASIGSTICGLLGIHSPSTVAQGWGENTGTGYANGLTNSTGEGTSAATSFINAIKGIFTGDSTLSGTATAEGAEAGSAFSSSLTNSTDLSGFTSVLNGSSIDLSSFQSMLSDSGTSGAESFTTGLTDGLDLSSFSSALGDGSSLDLSSFESMLSDSGTSSAESFSTGLTDGLDLSSFSSALGDGSSLDLSSFESMLSDSGTNSAESFSAGLTNGLDLSSFTNSLSGASSEISANEPEFSAAGEGLSNALGDGITNGTGKVTNAMTTLITTLVKSIRGKFSTFKDCGIKVITNFANGLNAKKSSVSNTARTVAASAVTAVRSKYSSMSLAGKYLGDGLIQGINAKKKSVYDAAYNLGKKAVQGEKDGQKSASPSKATIQAGKWLGEGLIIGMQKMGTKVYNAGYSMGENAVDSLSNSISNIASLVMDGMDAEPTIRPVLDLSDIKAGAGAIGNMLDVNPTVGVLSNTGAISSMMNNIQNGASNDDVVSAIADLGRKIGKMSNNTYNVNGVTYDDGSSISDAVRTLVRAARVERRV